MVMVIEAPTSHAPVMVAEILQALTVRPGGRYVDCTVGEGGHAEAILATAPAIQLLGIDVDPETVAAAQERLAPFGPAVRLTQDNFRDLAAVCRSHHFLPVDGALLDLGVSSRQLADARRGFSFQVEGPLDMRFGLGRLTAADVVNGWPEEEIAEVIWRYGEERHSRRIARAVIQGRPIRTTTALSAIVARAVGPAGARKRLHPATRTFQALRIATNDELGALSQALDQVLQVLAPGGRLAVISFHSLEDRIVKHFLQREARDCICPPQTPGCVCSHSASLRPLFRGALRPSPQEVAANPRSRSARVRAAEKL
jgi:16S rRNA (cytosine1402-N4)-methyltransferase